MLLIAINHKNPSDLVVNLFKLKPHTFELLFLRSWSARVIADFDLKKLIYGWAQQWSIDKLSLFNKFFERFPKGSKL